ncbi:MAG: 3-phosphoshikimate 1-carboxyvinyltransferase [Flammeovirgaceae bacterium]
MVTQQEKIALQHASKSVNAVINLPSSKSESNRALIIQALAGNQIQLANLSSARDTQTMIRLLKAEDELLDVLDAGTTMRFLTAYCTASNRKTILTGTARMKQRPIGILVDALRSLGGKITYEENEGYPPVKIHGFEQKANTVSIRGDVSSQYISALLMIAPTLKKGLFLKLTGDVGSKPYIEMTLNLMAHFGVQHHWEDNSIHINPTPYSGGSYRIESDWSGASYWYSIAALAETATIQLNGLRENSWQGDSALIPIMNQLGVKTEFNETGLQLSKQAYQSTFEYDFTNCPDLAQTIAVICAAKGIEAKLTGLKSLRIKETDRIAAIQTELAKFDVPVEVLGDDAIIVPPSTLQFRAQVIDTYEDHRMAMAFAPLALLGKIHIHEPSVVAKSYPSYWDDLAIAGFELT